MGILVVVVGGMGFKFGCFGAKRVALVLLLDRVVPFFPAPHLRFLAPSEPETGLLLTDDRTILTIFRFIRE